MAKFNLEAALKGSAIRDKWDEDAGACYIIGASKKLGEPYYVVEYGDPLEVTGYCCCDADELKMRFEMFED